MQVETLESRWTPAWAGVPPATVSLIPNPVSVTFNANNDRSATAAIATSEIDWYSFIAPVSGSYNLSAITPSSNLDPVIGLFSAAGTRIAYNDDISNTNTDSRITLNLVAGNRYYYGITNYTNTAGGAYTWTIDGPAPIVDDSYEQNDTSATAANLGALKGSLTIPNLVMADANDFYKFSLSATGTGSNYVQIAFNHSQGDLDFALYNSAGTLVGISESTTNAEKISLSGFVAGTYYARAYGYQSALNPNYTLSFNTPSPPTSGVDLRGASVDAVGSGNWGQPITVTASARNSGLTAAGAFQNQFWLSRDRTWSSDDIILTDLTGNPFKNFTGLAANTTSAAFSMTLSLPPALPNGWSGSTFYIVMRTDSANAVAETNEANNSGQLGVGIDSDTIGISTAGTSQFTISLALSGLTASQQAIFQRAAARWSQVIVGDLPNATYNGQTVDDVLIAGRGAAIDGAGGILGQAGPDAFRSGSNLPIHGVMEFDTADLAQLEANGTLLNVILHEMGHVLGIGTIWDSLGLLAGDGTQNPRFTGPQATTAYNQIFGTNVTGVPVEQDGGPGTAYGHWDEEILQTELMTGYAEAAGVAMPLSRITAASLADMGYQVNLAAADAYSKPALRSAVRTADNSSTAGSGPQLRYFAEVFALLASEDWIAGERERRR